jgi:NAD(P)-dependent dehydrogenase (short-subunit alcohol dehydrogenase family)
MSGWTADEMPAMDGKTVVVTGANSGLGYEGTKAFADAGATVVMACRSEQRGKRAAAEIRASVDGGELDVRVCDLADLDSVESFAEGVREAYDGIDVLCNNAGVMAIPRQETEEGFEMQLGVNHFGHFALTGHLLSALAESDGESRVVTQSSQAHTAGEMDFSNLNWAHGYKKWAAYGRSKLANLLFAYELQRRLDESTHDIVSVACHPGYADTELQFRGPREMGSSVRMAGMKVANALFGQSAAKGALPMLYAAASEEIIGGEYVGPGGLLDMRGHPEFQQSNAASQDEADAERLWTVSEESTGVSYGLG